MTHQQQLGRLKPSSDGGVQPQQGDPWSLRQRLTDVERQWFDPAPEFTYTGTRRRQVWNCTRVELNAFSAPALVEYLDRKLAEVGADQKLVPPAEVAREHAEEAHVKAVRKRIEDWLADRFDLDDMVDTVVTETKPGAVDERDVDQWVLDGYREDRAAYWREVIEDMVDAALDERSDALNDRIRQLVEESLGDDEQQ